MPTASPLSQVSAIRPTLNLYLNLALIVLAAGLPLYRKWVSIAAPLVLLLWFLEGGLRWKLGVLRRHPLTLAILAFVGFNLLSLLWSSHALAGLDYLAKYRYLLLVPVIATSLRPHFRRIAVTAAILGMMVSLGLLFLNAAGVLPWAEASPNNPAITMSHLDYSIFLGLAPLLALVFLVQEGTRQAAQSRRLALFALLCLVGLLVNIGRSGQLAFFSGLLVVLPLLFGRRRWWRFPAAVGVVVSLLLGSYAAAPVFRHRVDAAAAEVHLALAGENYSTNQGKRIAATIVACEMVREAPLLGTGVGANMPAFRQLLSERYQQFESAVAWFPHLHNQYLQVVTELGLIGLLLLMNIFVQLLRGPYLDRRAQLMAVSLAAVFAFGFLGDPYFHKQMTVALFGAVAGVLNAPGLSPWWPRSNAPS